MGHLKSFYPAAPGHAEKPLQPGKPEPVAIPLPLHIQQLNAGPLLAHLGIQGRGEDGGQHHVDPLLRRGCEEFFPQVPVLLRIYRHLIVVRQAVPVEPLGVNQLLVRQVPPHNPQGKPGLPLAAAGGNPHYNGIFPRGEALGNPAVDPQHRGQKGAGLHHALLDGQKGIGKQTRLGGQIVAVALVRIGRQRAGDLPHLEHLQALQGGLHRYPQRSGTPAVLANDRLKGKFLAAQAAHT